MAVADALDPKVGYIAAGLAGAPVDVENDSCALCMSDRLGNYSGPAAIPSNARIGCAGGTALKIPRDQHA